jgi:hypothetical protein
MVFFSTVLVVRFVKEFCFPSKAAAKVISLFLPPSDGETFFGCLANRLSKVTHLPLKAAAKVVHLFPAPMPISTFLRLFLEEKL